MTLLSIKSFFDKNYKTPNFLTERQLSRRTLLKSAAGMGAVAAIPSFSLSAKQQESMAQLTKVDPWLTLEATLKQLLPASATGPSAEDINALAYLHQVMTVQPTEEEEKDFILKGVGWLNGYANSEKNKAFVELTFNEKEQLLKGISQSRAGENWINTLLGYILQAMLSPPSYGGNTKGIGWQWLEHKAGFPLPEKGQRYFELPSRANIIKLTRLSHQEDK
jgi:gluconate 2-dehydrogenase gamma chain